MKFTPDYNVMYKGVFYEADETFEIDDKDSEEMIRHGEVEWGDLTSSKGPETSEKEAEKDPLASSETNNPNDPLYVPENPGSKEDEPSETPVKRGRPKKEA